MQMVVALKNAGPLTASTSQLYSLPNTLTSITHRISLEEGILFNTWALATVAFQALATRLLSLSRTSNTRFVPAQHNFLCQGLSLNRFIESYGQVNLNVLSVEVRPRARIPILWSCSLLPTFKKLIVDEVKILIKLVLSLICFTFKLFVIFSFLILSFMILTLAFFPRTGFLMLVRGF